MNKPLLAILCWGLWISNCWAAEKAESQDNCNEFILSGYLQASLNHLERKNRFISGVFDRVNDIKEDGFALQQAAVAIQAQSKSGWQGYIQGILGMDSLFSLAPFGYDPHIGSNSIGFVPLQIYVSYLKSPLRFDVGNFNTLVGTEANDPTLNKNFSYSNLANFSQPTTVLGLRGTYTVNDKLKFILGINNGWDNIRDTDRHKTLEWGITYTDPLWMISAQGYAGEERNVVNVDAVSPLGTRLLFDVTATLTITESVDIAANYDYGSQQNGATQGTLIVGDATWQGFAGYFNCKFNKNWRASLRFDIFDDHNGFRTGVEQTLKEATLTLGYVLFKNMELMAETRMDYSDVASFVDRHSSTTRTTQHSYSLSGIYKFANNL